MRTTAAQQQKQHDTDAELEARAEALEAQARDELTELRAFNYLRRHEIHSGVTVTDTKTSFDVLEALYDLRDGELAQALSMLGKGRDDNLLGLLAEAKATAIEQVMGQIDFDEWAACEREQQQQEAA